jgi:hypothetical protein
MRDFQCVAKQEMNKMTRISKNLYEKRAIRKQDTKDDTFDPLR